MNKKLKNCIWVLGLALYLLPYAASAHATPVTMTPESSEHVDAAPKQVSIKFSEHIDLSASAITITSPKETVHEKVSLDPSDQRILVAPLTDDGEGTYIVSWSVVSSDDGHFTKGAYAFAVGANAITATTTSDTEIIEIATTPEALSMTVELFGNGMIWAGLLLFIFAMRKLLQSGKFGSEEEIIKRGYVAFIVTGVLCAFVGGALQLWVKGVDLAQLRDVSFINALPIYLGTTAGIATAMRMAAVCVVLALILFGKKMILAAKRISAYEILMILSMFVFAYYRAKISHATANPFHPGFSIFINFIHLIEKDVWAGVMLALVLLALFKRTRKFLIAVIPHAFLVLTIDLLSVSITASYIVWLHLKSFDNLLSTQWGGAFLPLLASALLLVGLRIYHVFAQFFARKWFLLTLPFSFALEFAFALLVVYYSSVVIITSPPLATMPTPVYTHSDQGVEITLKRDIYEDGMLMLTLLGGTPQTPVVTVDDTNGSVGALSVELQKRSNSEYVFPQSLLSGTGPFDIAVHIPQNNAYDASADFSIAKNAFAVAPNWEAHRPLDAFTLFMIAFALCASLCAGALLWLSVRQEKRLQADAMIGKPYPVVLIVAIVVGVLFLTAEGLAVFSSSSYANPFKAKCEADGNMWHLMLPSKAGVPVSQQPQEGCMWGMGNYLYMFPDKNEYDYFNKNADAIATFAHVPEVITTGATTTLTFSIKNADGSPAPLFVDMDKLIHVVIISKDETVFAHIHPDDIHPLTKEAIDASTFSVEYNFPKAGKYLVAIDYADGLRLESKQFPIDVSGSPSQQEKEVTYPSPGTFDGYTVALNYLQPFAGQVLTLQYTFTKDGKPVTNIVPYLSGAMHIAVVKNDFSEFLHIHGEVHAPGAPLPPIIIKDGKVLHSMANMVALPATFGPNIEAHLIFPTAGIYTLWGQFKVGDTVIPTSFTVRVE